VSLPADGVDAFAQHGLGDVLHAREAVDDRVLAGAVALRAEAGTEAAVAEQHGGRAVAHHLGQARIEVDLQVEVRVNVEEPGHEPQPRTVNDAAGAVGRQVHAACRHAAVMHGDVEALRCPATAIKDRSIADQHVPAVGCCWTGLLRLFSFDPLHDVDSRLSVVVQ
jgi:hypothetical protein